MNLILVIAVRNIKNVVGVLINLQYYYITDIKWETKPINKMFSVSRKVLPNQICLTESVVSQATEELTD